MSWFYYINGNNRRLNFCNAAIFYDYKNIGITCELNQVRKCLNCSFYKTIPQSRILGSLSVRDDIFLKINDNAIENIIENVHDLRENILYFIPFEKMIKDEQHTINTICDENNSEPDY